MATVMRCTLLLSVFLWSTLVCIGAEVDPRVQELLIRSRRAKDRVVHLNDELFQRFGTGDEPRPYSLIIFFDAKQVHKEHAQLRLPHLRKEFGVVATSYAQTHKGTPEASRVFFCDLEFKESTKTFQGFSVQALPNVRLLPEGKGKSSPLDPNVFGFSAEGMASFVTAKTGIDVGKIQRPPLIATWQLVSIAAVVLATLPFIIRYILTHKTIVHDARFWCLGGLLIYFFSVSGGMYNIIRGMPMFTMDQNSGKPVYWYHTSGAQFGAEGFTIGSLYSVVGLLLAFIVYGAPYIEHRQVQRGIIGVSLFVAFKAVQQVGHIDNWKTGYHVHPYFPNSWR